MKNEGCTYGKRWLGWIVLSVFIFHFSSSFAQPRLERPEYWLGLHGGVSASTVLFNPAQSGMSPITKACVLGGNGGLVFRYAGHQYCAFQMELNYVHRGWAQQTSAGSTLHSLHYIELPILMHLNVGSETCRWLFDLGPQIGYCVLDESYSIDKRFDWGLAAGTGVEFHTRKAGVYYLEIRYDFSLGGVFGTSVTDSYSMANPMDLSLNLGWVMPVRHRRKLKVESL
ncbi:MAG: PorT family protein [Paludibacteraceae bacterium]|nr:PorT family protein [Paludibacteraceae bacterium]